MPEIVLTPLYCFIAMYNCNPIHKRNAVPADNCTQPYRTKNASLLLGNCNA